MAALDAPVLRTGKATVNQDNYLIDEDFGRDLAGTIPFTGTRFFALTTNSCVLATVGGLTIDGSCRVLDTDDRVIEGLYATGNVSGTFYAGNYPRHIPGTSVGRAATFGYVAAEHMLKGGRA